MAEKDKTARYEATADFCIGKGINVEIGEVFEHLESEARHWVWGGLCQPTTKPVGKPKRKEPHRKAIKNQDPAGAKNQDPAGQKNQDPK